MEDVAFDSGPSELRRTPSQNEQEEFCYFRSKFDVNKSADAAYVLKHVWALRNPSLKFCEAVLAQDDGLYKEVRDGDYWTIFNWPLNEHASDLSNSIHMDVDSTGFPVGIRQFLDELLPGIRSVIFGDAATFDHWPIEGSVSSSMDPTVARHIRDLRVPSLGERPSILLHDLGGFRNDPILKNRVANIFLEGNHTFLVNTSGSGKTRLLLEGLCENWGFYFTSLEDASHLGSADVQNTINRHLPNSPEFSKDLRASKSVPGHPHKTRHRTRQQEQKALEENRRIAASIFNKVFLARLMIFDIFVKTMSKCEGYKTAHYLFKEKWLHVQLRPQLLSPSTWDVFNELTIRLLEMRDADRFVDEQTRILLRAVQAFLGPELSHGRSKSTSRQTPLFCVLDEAQHASSEHTLAFRSSSEPHSPRPVLQEIVRSWQSQCAGHGIFMVVAGTGISKDVVDRVMASGVMKASMYRWCSDTGEFMCIQEQRKYIEKYLPQDLIQTRAGERLMQRIWHWLRGRHRFTAGFVTALLENGFRKPHTLLNRYIHHFTQFSPTDGQPFVQEEEKDPDKTELKIPSELLENNQRMLENVRRITAHYLLGSIKIPLGEDDAKYVQYGYSRFFDSAAREATMDEPLVLLSASHWLNANDHSTKHPFWTDRIGTLGQVGGAEGEWNGFENYLAFCLHLAFSGGRKLSDVFNFRGNHLPPWANEEAQLVAISQLTPGGGLELGQEESILSTDAGPSAALGMHARSIDLALSWLNHADHTAICFPHKHMGPDLLFVLRLQDGKKIWVALQAKYITLPQIKKADLRSALRSVTPECFFVDATGQAYTPQSHTGPPPGPCALSHLQLLENRQETSAGPYSLLRVVATFPARTNLKRMESEDQNQHPLASLDMEFIKRLTANITPTRYLERLQPLAKSMKGQRSKRKMTADPAPSSSAVRKKRKVNLNESIPS
ncbi:hypothetical protein BDN72DRAFT_768678 [Pluteus cervinus]|uniref:Uncharacterized protein n=1 Tax=Pluteus cervinus TaxID=181527 RepID=A0ACD3ASJ2_9AGAR|nr:hypothetical protein BDN72DRAFT_768678 [Pluteus cervinus]